MGCVQGKPSPTYNRQHSRGVGGGGGLQKLKIDNGYVTVGPGKQSSVVAHKPAFVEIPVIKDNNIVNNNTINSNNNNNENMEKEAGGEDDSRQQATIIGKVSQRNTGVIKKIGSDELIDGWPKWLVDNIPSHVLSNLVSKTADSYDKLAKVSFTYSALIVCLCTVCSSFIY